MTVSAIAERIALRLDTTIAFEAIILNRLLQLSAARREEWLRGLLVRGFQCECRELRALSCDEGLGPIETPRAPISNEQQSVIPIREQTNHSCTAENVVSFAALTKVIG